MQLTLSQLFESFLDRSKIFRDKSALRSNYIPEELPHRDEQIEQLASILAPTIKKETPSNIFIYGKVGTGKTAVTKYVSRELEAKAIEKGAPLKIIYINCKMEKITTEYRLLARILRELNEEIPFTGLPTSTVYRKFFEKIDDESKVFIVVLDEIDSIKQANDCLYDLTRINYELKESSVSIIGISNNINFIEGLDPRVRSSLGEEEIIFPPYNALQLRDILEQRAEIAFYEDALTPEVIPKCAALAAQEHGDARKALDLLRVAGEIAERRGDYRVTEKHVDMAEEKLDMDRVIEIVKTQPKQSKIVLYSILSLTMLGNNGKEVSTGEVYNLYEEICKRNRVKILTQRRVSELISELDMLGIINAKVISKGRYGRTREISLAVSEITAKKLINMLSTFLQ